MRSKILFAAAAVSLLAIAPIAYADTLGPATYGSVTFSGNTNAPGLPSTTIAVGACEVGSCILDGGYTLVPDGTSGDNLIWNLLTTLPTLTVTSPPNGMGQVPLPTVYSQFPTFASGTDIFGLNPVSMNGTTSTLQVSDSAGDDVFGSVVWIAVQDPGDSAATLFGTFTVTSANLAALTNPFESVWINNFPNTGIAVGDIDTIQLSVTSCAYGGAPVDCLQGDPTGGVSGFSIESQTLSPTTAPEPSSLFLLASGMLGLLGLLGFAKRQITHSQTAAA